MSDAIALTVCCVAVWLAFRRIRWIVLPPMRDEFRIGDRKAIVLIVPGRPIDWPPGTYMLSHAASACQDRRGIWIKVYGPSLPVRPTLEGEVIPAVDPYRGWVEVSESTPIRTDPRWLGFQMWDCRDIPLERIGIVRRLIRLRFKFQPDGPIQWRGMVKYGSY